MTLWATIRSKLTARLLTLNFLGITPLIPSVQDRSSGTSPATWGCVWCDSLLKPGLTTGMARHRSFIGAPSTVEPDVISYSIPIWIRH
eukprot:9115387-Lingulodinium_polyedra.AAC.1